MRNGKNRNESSKVIAFLRRCPNVAEISASRRGYNFRMWRSGDIQFCLVSDVSEADLRELEQHWADPLFAEPSPTEFEHTLIVQFRGLTAAASKAGVHLRAGTDLGDPYVIPGYALHDELELMVKAGVPTLTALQSATSEPALAFGLTSIVGSVTTGHAADLVVLDADPLQDIANTRRIDAVVLNGVWIHYGAPD